MSAQTICRSARSENGTAWPRSPPRRPGTAPLNGGIEEVARTPVGKYGRAGYGVRGISGPEAATRAWPSRCGSTGPAPAGERRAKESGCLRPVWLPPLATANLTGL